MEIRSIVLWPFLLFIIFQFFACSRYSAVLIDDSSLIQYIDDSLHKDWRSSELDYIDTRYIRTYFHFFDDQDGALNFTETDGRRFVNQLVFALNERLRINDKMNLPLGNDTEVLDSRIRIQVSGYQGKQGIFFHKSTEPECFVKFGKNRNLYDRDIIQNFAIRHDSVVNVFILPFQPEQLKSQEQKIEKTAIALGTSIKLAGAFESKAAGWEYAGIFGHELGHVLGLRHTWKYDDGCADTPKHSNCWNQGDEPPCEQMYSNNFMDYNAHQSSITPCQILKMHSAINLAAQRGKVVAIPNWCRKNSTEKIVIVAKEKWTIPMLIDKDIEIDNGGSLYISGKVHMSEDTEIRIKKGGQLILDGATFFNSCGQLWKGIYAHPKAEILKSGKLQILDIE